ncbi:hypothetical protein [Pelomonas aquatica]|jgi:hypothetical protein|uniref:hypothetical protein n=1 Tax=Pelomonas aquatica TaxID=431058 RepID=UPI00227CE930|nr:hypothetical protein [Pelomonas aquatica]MCY4754638.1 hypothetical protein [Pelomonas aquatica]
MARNEPYDAPERARFSEVNAMKSNVFPQALQPGGSNVLRTRQHRLTLCWFSSFAAVFAAMLPLPARAVDGCTVLLCLAAPSWRSIEQCVPPVRQVLRDLARGKPFPTCAMAGAGNTASHTWSAAPNFCPQQYTRVYDGPNGALYTCDYDGAISVTVDGVPFARTWWSMSGDSVTDFSPAAKAQLGTWDKRFDDEFAAWLANQPASAAPQY